MDIPTSAGSFQQTNLNSASRGFYNPSPIGSVQIQQQGHHSQPQQLHHPYQFQSTTNYSGIPQLTATNPNQSLPVFATPNSTTNRTNTAIEPLFNPNNAAVYNYIGNSAVPIHSHHQPQQRAFNSNNTRNLTPSSVAVSIGPSGIPNYKFYTPASRTSTNPRQQQHTNYNYMKQTQQQQLSNMNTACNTYQHQQQSNYQSQSLQNQQQHNQNQHLRSSTVGAAPAVAIPATSGHSVTGNSVPSTLSAIQNAGNSIAVRGESQSGQESPQYRIFKRGDTITAGGMISPPTVSTAPTTGTKDDAQREEGDGASIKRNGTDESTSKLENGSTGPSTPQAIGNTSESSSGNPLIASNSNPGTTNVTNSHKSSSGSSQRTPLSLINELAKYHSLLVEYHMIKETGPPHCPTFTVQLKLGEAEAYIGEGSSIKRAQLAAAGEALAKTTFSKPVPRTAPVANRRGYGNRYGGAQPHGHGYSNQTALRGGGGGGAPFVGVGPNYPLVQLTALAAELNQPLSFINQPMEIADPFSKSHPPHRVAVHVGERVFIGEGNGFNTAKNLAVLIALKALLRLKQDNELGTNPAAVDEDEEDLSNKSPISLVHEMGMKRGMAAVFEVVSESGPAHMKSFTVKCSIGEELVTEGLGATKQLAKKQASVEMINKLKQIPLPVQNGIPIGVNSIKYIQRGFAATTRLKIKRNKTAARPTVVRDASNQPPTSPISRLIQIAHLRKYKEPEFIVILNDASEAVAEAAAQPLEPVRFNNRRTDRYKKKPVFHIEVRIGPHVARGQGANKKVAKKNAADNALILLGYPPSSPQPNENKDNDVPESTNKSSNAKSKSPTTELNMTSARQIVPGLIVLTTSCESPTTNSTVTTPTSQSSVAQSIQKVNALPKVASSSPHESVDKLAYLSQLLEVGVSYSDFPKKSEFLSVVSLGTSPPHVAHGIAASVEEARNAAALQLLTELASIGLDNCVKQEVKPEASAGKGPSDSDATASADLPNSGTGATPESVPTTGN